MKSLRIATLTVTLALLLPFPAHANFKEVTVKPGVSTETTLAFFATGLGFCTPVPGMTAQITVQPKHGTAVIAGGTYTTPNCPGVSFPGVQANYTWTDVTGKPGSGGDSFHVTFTAPPGFSQIVDVDILIAVGFPGKLLGPLREGASNSVPVTTGTPACQCTGDNSAGGSGGTGKWPFKPGAPANSSPAPSVTGGISVGEPIDVASGNMSYEVTDYLTAGPNPLAFIRYYNSGASISGFAKTLGPNWRSNYDRYIDILSPNVVNVERPGGKILGFAFNGTSWVTDTDVDVTLTHSGTTWTLTTPDDTVDTYSQVTLGTLLTNEAVLTSVKSRNGYTQNLFYNGSNQLASVTDSYNRTLTFAYANGLLTNLITPDNNSFVYAYNPNNTLSFMASPVDINGGATYSYFYEDSALPNALTGVGDRYGERINTWTYDGVGRGLTSSQGGTGVNANLTTIAYNDATGSRTVTNPLGVTDTYTFTTLQFIPKVTQISRAATSSTPAMTRSFTYDANGYLANQTDWNGNQTTYANNAHGQPTTINEAVGKPEARTTTIVYNAILPHLPASVTTPGITASFTYDASGNLLARTLTDTTATTVPYVTKGQTRSWAFTYDATGHVLSVKSPRTDVTATTTLTYDGSGALTAIANPLSQSVNVTSHTGGGFPLTIKDPNGVTTTLTYDGQMRVTSSTVATSGGALTTQYGYWFGDLLFSVKPPDGSELDSSPDAALRPLNIVDAYGDFINYTLDALGDRTQINITDANKNLTRQHSATFDALGRKLTDVGGVGQTSAFTYDNNGNALTISDPLNHKTSQLFDGLNRLTKSTDANGGVTTITYDAHDRPLSVTDPNSNATTYVYDGFGDMIQQANPDSGTSVYRYDANGNLTSKTDAASVVTNYTYDALDRIATTTYPADATLNVTYTYDQTGHGFGVGRLTGLTDAAGSLSRSYDERGNLLSEQRTSGATTLTTAYTYDKASRVASVTYPSGATVSYTHDLTGNVVAMPFAAANADAQFVGWFAHLPFGPLNSVNYNNGDLARFTFDADYRLTTMAYESFQSVPYFKWSYAYDAADNVSSVTDSITSANSQTFGYDLLNRLTSAGSSGTYGSLAWAYDKNGNLMSRTSAGVATSYTYTPGSNHLAVAASPSNSQTFSYTATGNISGVTQNGSAIFTGSYSKANRLASVTGPPLAISAIVYDAFGKRFSKANPGSTPTTFVYDQDGNLIEENNNGIVTDYIYMDGINVSNWAPSEKHLYAINFDRLGTPLVGRDEFGLTNWAAFSQPYGAMTQTVAIGQFSGPVTQNLRLPGQYFDSETGFHYNGFRDYMPGLGRYLESDPIGLGGGLNIYGYVGGNPMSFVDPTGLWPEGPFHITLFPGYKKQAEQRLPPFLQKADPALTPEQAEQLSNDIVEAIGTPDVGALRVLQNCKQPSDLTSDQIQLINDILGRLPARDRGAVSQLRHALRTLLNIHNPTVPSQ
jgi:RHS repeat-associated protein